MRGREGQLRFDSPGQLKQLFRRNGFHRIKILWIPILPGRFRVLQRLVESGITRVLFAGLPWVGRALSHAYVVAAEKTGRLEPHR
jgi:hypothetical protein